MATASRRALIVAGEASGDLHGANLIKAARRLDPGLSFFGVAGPRMAEAGCEVVVPSEELSVMGLVEVIGHLPKLQRVFRRLVTILNGPQRPDVLVLIDFQDFNQRLAKRARAAGVPVLFYIGPKVWAWRSGRARTIGRVVDRLAVIFPFEPDCYRGEAVEVEYVGNPLADEAKVKRGRDEFLRQYGLDPAAPVVGLFPGSRRSEIRYVFETIKQGAEQIRESQPQVQFLLPVASSLRPQLFSSLLAESDLPITLVEDDIYDTANACDAVVCVSGTVTLQTALVGTPMVIVYKMSPLSYEVGRRIVKVEHIGLANIVAGEEVARELIQNEANSGNIAFEILRILEDPEYRLQLRQGLAKVWERIGSPGCAERVARMASEMSRGIVHGKGHS
ncbi:MAG TPA: lipid-A-disaccharide synthase [Desulfuromonadales bacterium]|nr:lipid-A-disaccharide synthase [Desulfuromonadales bacterium]